MPQHTELAKIPLNIHSGNYDSPPPITHEDLRNFQWQLSNLNLRSGMTGYLAGNKGYFIGFSKGVVGITDGTPVFSVGNPTGHYVAWDGSELHVVGNVTVTGGTVTGALTVSTGGYFNSGMTAYNTGTGWWMDYNAGTPRMALGNPAGAHFTWDGTAYKIYNSSNVIVFDSTNLLYRDGTTTIDSLKPAELGATVTATNVCNASTLIATGVCYDGVAVTFPTAYASAPTLIFGAGGLTYDSTLPAGDQEQVYQATAISASGFTPSLKIQNVASSPASQSVNFSPYNTATNSASATLTVPGGSTILNGAITVNFSVQLGPDETDEITVKDGTALLWSKTVVTGLSTKTFIFSAGLTDPAAVNGTVITIADTLGLIKATTCTYTTGTAATSHSATPSGVNGVIWLAYPPN